MKASYNVHKQSMIPILFLLKFWPDINLLGCFFLLPKLRYPEFKENDETKMFALEVDTHAILNYKRNVKGFLVTERTC